MCIYFTNYAKEERVSSTFRRTPLGLVWRGGFSSPKGIGEFWGSGESLVFTHSLISIAASFLLNPRALAGGVKSTWIGTDWSGLTGLIQAHPCAPNRLIGIFGGFDPLEEFPLQYRPTPVRQTRP